MAATRSNRLDEERWRRLERSLCSAMAQEVPEWTHPRDGDPGVTIVELFAFLAEELLFRADVIPERARRRFSEGVATLVSRWPPCHVTGVQVYVEGTEWRRIVDLAQAGPEDQVYTAGEDGHIEFGDGRHGKLPEGGNHVVATYVSGSGTRVSLAFTWPPVGSRYTLVTGPRRAIAISTATDSSEQFMGDKRVNYFDGQRLNSADFRSEQEYLIRRRWLHNRMLHGWGVVNGLAVSAGSPSSDTIIVAPGLAIDGTGREVILNEPTTLTATGTSPLFVVVSYAERQTDAVPGPEGSMASRIEEGACVSLSEQLNTADGIAVARLLPDSTGWTVDATFEHPRVPR